MNHKHSQAKSRIVRNVLITVAGILLFWKILPYVMPTKGNFYEKYEVKASFSSLSDSIYSFFRRNKNLMVPSDIRSLDGTIDSTLKSIFLYRKMSGNYYIFSPERNELIHFRTGTEYDNNNAFIYLVAINKGKVLGNWKEFNYDLSKKENEDEKAYFDSIFLKQLHLKYVHKWNWLFPL